MKVPLIAVDRPSPEDAEAIAELCNALGREHYGEPVVDGTEVRRWFDLPNLYLWVARAADGRLAAYAEVEEEDEGRRYWLDLREHPRLSEHGGARALLEATEAWARTRAAAGALFRGVVPSVDDNARALYEKAGYRFIRHMLEMRIELDAEPPEPQWPEGIRARTFVPGEDEHSVYEADMEAFEDHWEFFRIPFEEWRAWTIEDPRFDPSLWFLAEEGESLAGLSLCGLHPAGDPSFGSVWILGVRRPWRRRGLGLALLTHTFREFRRRGMTRAGLDVDAENLTGAVRLYERAGMHVAKRRDIYETPLAPAEG